MLYGYRYFHCMHKNRCYLQRIAEDVDTLNYELECIERPLPKGKNKKVIGLMKNELGGKIMTKFVKLRAKTLIYLIDLRIK